MSKSLKLTNNNYWDASGITYNRTLLSTFLNNQNTSLTNCINTQNTFLANKGVGLACFYADTNIAITGAYTHYPTLNLILDRRTTTNFYGAGGGIAVSKSGHYIVSGAINSDMAGENFQIHVMRSDGAVLFIIDSGAQSGMVSTVIPAINVYLAAGQYVYLRVGASVARTYMFRGGRTMLNIISIDSD